MNDNHKFASNNNRKRAHAKSPVLVKLRTIVMQLTKHENHFVFSWVTHQRKRQQRKSRTFGAASNKAPPTVKARYASTQYFSRIQLSKWVSSGRGKDSRVQIDTDRYSKKPTLTLKDHCLLHINICYKVCERSVWTPPILPFTEQNANRSFVY